jgi:hypothetical protein
VSDFAVNSVVIIESLGTDEFKSGRALQGHIQGLTHEFNHIPPVYLYEVSGLSQFLDTLNQLTENANLKNQRPVLHIEVHGREDQDGISFTDGSYILWSGLASHLSELNRATQFNLLVCVAACFGAHSLSMVRSENPAPCLVLIGPTKITTGPELLMCFRQFYRELLSKLDLTMAITGLTQQKLEVGGFLVQEADDWFFNVITGYLESECTNKRIKERAWIMYKNLPKKNRPLTPAPLESALKKASEEAIDWYFEIFFMTSFLPNNFIRFADKLSMGKDQLKKFFQAQNEAL